MEEKTFVWDGSPLTRGIWLHLLAETLQENKSTRELCERGWVLSHGKVAV